MFGCSNSNQLDAFLDAGASSLLAPTAVDAEFVNINSVVLLPATVFVQ